MGGIMLNEDCNHFVYTRYAGGVKVGLNELYSFIDQYEGTQVKEFFMNINAMLAWFPAKSRQNVIDKYYEIIKSGIVPGKDSEYVKTSCEIFQEQGIDMYKVWIDRLRDKSISPWVSIRMNDLHNNDDSVHFLHSDFFIKNNHLRRAAYRPNSNYYDNALDFMHEEVREHYISLIREAAERYDFDGLELDWMREVYSLQIGSEIQGRAVITELVKEIRSILDEAENLWNHKIKLGVRVPYSPETSLRFGLDAVSWAKNGLVDLIVPTARWATTDNDMPIDLWKQILEGTGVMLGAGLEILIEATRNEPKQVMFTSLESVRGSAATYLNMGADRIYLFNYMDSLKDNFPQVLIGSSIDSPDYQELLNTIGELDTIGDKRRRHITTYHDITAPGVKVGDRLPLCCKAPNEKGKLHFSDVRVATGLITETSEITLVLGVNDIKELNADDFSVYVDATACEFIGKVELPKPCPPCTMYAFRVKNRKGFPTACIIEIAALRNAFDVVWVEIDVV